MLNGKDKYDSIIDQARKEKDPNVKITLIIEILDMLCGNEIPHVIESLKRVDRKLTWALVLGGMVAVFLFITHPEIFNIFKVLIPVR